jgi:hypothetical protein
VHDSVKQYLLDMIDEGKLKRVMKGREYFYRVVETEGGEVVTGSEQLNLEQPIKFCANEPSEAR